MVKRLIFLSYLCLLLPILWGNNLLGQVTPLRFTFSERFRMVGWDNAIDLDKNGGTNQHFTRHRTSAGLQWKPNQTFTFEAKLTHEFRKFFTPSNASFHWNEVFFDQLYFSYQSEKYLRGKLTVGRQNIFLGEGFIVWDGHPVDGSRSVYFNAVRYDLNLSEKHKVSAFIAVQPKEEKLLPVFNGQDIDPVFQGTHSYQLIEQSEKAMAIYYTGKADASNWDVYFVWKTIEDDGTRLVPQSDIKTYGGRLKQKISNQLSFTLEAAFQSGLIGAEKRTAYGGYSYLSYFPGQHKKIIPIEVQTGAFLLSGNKLSTGKHEAWEPVFGRWPKWSESYIYTSLRENQGRVAYWSNMLAPNIQGKFDLGQSVILQLHYYRLFAMEQTATTDFLSGNGKDRGHLLTAKMGFAISKQLSGHVLWEYFSPGNFYFAGADPYHWARIELLFSL
jgi:hypothetical protein